MVCDKKDFKLYFIFTKGSGQSRVVLFTPVWPGNMLIVYTGPHLSQIFFLHQNLAYVCEWILRRKILFVF